MQYHVTGKRENGRQCNLIVHCSREEEVWNCALQGQPDLVEIHTLNGESRFSIKPVEMTGEPLSYPQEEDTEEYIEE